MFELLGCANAQAPIITGFLTTPTWSKIHYLESVAYLHIRISFAPFSQELFLPEFASPKKPSKPWSYCILGTLNTNFQTHKTLKYLMKKYWSKHFNPVNNITTIKSFSLIYLYQTISNFFSRKHETENQSKSISRICITQARFIIVQTSIYITST